ncbi:HlyD family type I secretion periplasmic adaptor subunit [Pelagibacterium sp.]|uniref:HlyD family type I secretion periplasmic adaptor subunit n=1 Tax=Pelagibacterium sp. TaxID=1967288 RepID=UPI003A920FC9
MTAIETANLNHGRAKSGAERYSFRGRVVSATILGVLLIGGVGGWAVTAPLSSAIIGVGTVLVDEDIKLVQHPDGGVVKSIAVREGDFVTEGQVLVRLDDAQIRAERTILQGQLAELEVRQARLLAEANSTANMVLSSELLVAFPAAARIFEGEQQVFAGNLARHQSQREQLALQIAQLNREIEGLEFQVTATRSELELARAELVRLRRLAENNLVETARVSAAERDVVRLQGQTGDLNTSIARARVRIADVELQILDLDGTRQTDAQRELRAVEAQIAEIEERLGAAEAQFARTEILATATGVVNELNIATIGGVISPAERIATIVPEDADLTIEFRVALNDIDQIHVDQPATLRFSAFNHRTTPEVEGTVTRISAATQQDSQTGESYYVAQVHAQDTELALGSGQLVPGMPVEVFVETEQQTALSYFLKPFTDQITRAFREE